MAISQIKAPLQKSIVVRDYNTGAVLDSSAVNSTVNMGYDEGVIVSSKNPNWKTQIVRRQNAATPYVRVISNRVSTSPARATYYTLLTSPKQKHEAVLYDPGVAKFSDIDTEKYRAEDRALARMKRQIRNLSEGYQALVPIVELRELRGTVKSIAQLSLSFLDEARRIRRGRYPNWVRLRNDIRNAWLSYSFGVAPLVSDANGIIASIAAFLARQDVTHVITTRGSDRFVLTDDIGAQSSSTFTEFSRTRIRDCVVNVRYEAGWTFNIRSAEDYTLLRHLGLNSASNLVNVGYQTTPFSWLFDYFTNMGGCVEDTFTSLPGSNYFIVRTERTFCRMTVRSTPRATFPSQVTWLKNESGESVIDIVDFRRSVPTSLPSRSFRFYTLDEVGRSSINKVLNLIALIREERPAWNVDDIRRDARNSRRVRGQPNRWFDDV